MAPILIDDFQFNKPYDHLARQLRELIPVQHRAETKTGQRFLSDESLPTWQSHITIWKKKIS